MIELYSSYNYHFVFFAVKAMFFEVESVDEIFQDESLLKEALDLCAFIVSKSLDVNDNFGPILNILIFRQNP